MKFFYLILLFGVFSFLSTTDTLESTGDREELSVKVTFKNGETGLFSFSSIEEFSSSDLYYEDAVLFECTYMFRGGECTVTASTCELAQAGFEACACEAGHDHFCDAEE